MSTTIPTSTVNPGRKKQKSYYVRKGGWGGARVKGSKKALEAKEAARRERLAAKRAAAAKARAQRGEDAPDDDSDYARDNFDGAVSGSVGGVYNNDGLRGGRQYGVMGQQSRSPEL
jgi:hypothetical protein